MLKSKYDLKFAVCGYQFAVNVNLKVSINIQMPRTESHKDSHILTTIQQLKNSLKIHEENTKKITAVRVGGVTCDKISC